jgi:uncharacterized membrane protein YccC
LSTAVCLALFTTFYLQLDQPYWAGTSAAIVCQPIVGSSLLKGVFRLIGTLIGTVAALALTAVFPQDRFGFLFGMLVWASACSFVSTLLKNFAAYGAMLAGYTLIIIASTSIPDPDQIFPHRDQPSFGNQHRDRMWNVGDCADGSWELTTAATNAFVRTHHGDG